MYQWILITLTLNSGYFDSSKYGSHRLWRLYNFERVFVTKTQTTILLKLKLLERKTILLPIYHSFEVHERLYYLDRCT